MSENKDEEKVQPSYVTKDDLALFAKDLTSSLMEQLKPSENKVEEEDEAIKRVNEKETKEKEALDLEAETDLAYKQKNTLLEMSDKLGGKFSKIKKEYEENEYVEGAKTSDVNKKFASSLISSFLEDKKLASSISNVFKEDFNNFSSLNQVQKTNEAINLLKPFQASIEKAKSEALANTSNQDSNPDNKTNNPTFFYRQRRKEQLNKQKQGV